ncbi:MAG: O-antigen ligase family protein [Pseudomonadota bacterium]
MVQTYSATDTGRFENLGNLAREFAAWIPALLISYSAIIDPVINFGSSLGVEVSGFNIGADRKNTAFARLFFPLVMGITLLCAIFAKPRFNTGYLLVGIIGLSYTALALISTFWSVSPPHTQNSSIYAAILYGTLFLSIAIAPSAEKVVAPIAYLFAAVIAANLVIVLVKSASIIGHYGIFDHKNNLGGFGACAFLFGLFAVKKDNLFGLAVSVFLVLGSLILLYASGSKTAQALTILAPVFALVYFVSVHALRVGFVLTTCLVAGIIWSGFLIGGQLFGFTFDDALFEFFGDTTFTGRTEIWSFVRAYISDEPLVGYGYRGFWSLGTDSPKFLSNIDFIRTIGSSHNGFLDVLLDLGLLGLSIVVTLILATLIAIANAGSRLHSLTLLYFSLVFFVLGRNLTESVIMWSTFLDNLLFIAVGLLATHRVIHQSQKSTGTTSELRIAA